MNQWLLRNRLVLFAVLNLAALLVVPASAIVHGVSIGRAVYVCLLLALCTAPFTQMTSFAGRFTLLQIFAALYFLDFGATDMQYIISGAPPISERLGFFTAAPLFFTPAEMVILAGAMLLGTGFLTGLRLGAGAGGPAVRAEWPQATTMLVGLASWLTGSAVTVYLQVFVVPEKSNYAFAHGFANLGGVGSILVMLGTYMQPLGLVILAYGYAKFRGPIWTTIIIAVVVTQAAIGFVTDVKLTAMMGMLVVIVIRVLVDNRVSLPWLVSGIVFVIIAFPVYQAYRIEITGQRGMNRLQAFNDIGKVLAIAWSRRDDVKTLRVDERAPTFLERTDIKENVEQVVFHLGDDVPYLYGESMTDLPLAFVPRILIGPKQSISIEQLYTHQILRSDEDTFISISHMGEMYWNFGWVGVVIGMSLEGLILGFVAMRFSLEQGVSMTRVMILLVTVQYLCVTFEGPMTGFVVVWMRSVAAIGLLHLLFASRAAGALPKSATPMADPRPKAPASDWSPLALPRPAVAQRAPRFPNVLR